MDIRLIALDVDGVLTDGKLYIGTDGFEYKSFHVKDGMGITLAAYAGLKIAWISGRKSEAVKKRAMELKVDYLYEGIKYKMDVLNTLVNELNIQLNHVFFMGDDLNDLPIIRKVGFSAVPNDAMNLLKKEANYVCRLKGGHGCVREAIDYFFYKYMNYDELMENFLNGVEMGQ